MSSISAAASGRSSKQVAAGAEQRAERKDQALPQVVDGRVGHLGEALLEVVVEGPGLRGEDRQRRIIAHGADRLLPVLGHGAQDDGQLFRGVPKGELLLGRAGALAARPVSRGLGDGRGALPLGGQVRLRTVAGESTRRRAAGR